MTHGGLPPRRPDQQTLPSPRGVTPGARISRLGGTPQSRSVDNASPQVATAFFTFGQRGRLFAAEITFAVASNAGYSGSVEQFYARITTASGIRLGSVQLCLSGPTQIANGQGGLTFPDTGVPVDKGDQLLLDVNNNIGVNGGTGGLMRADCSVFFTLP